MDKTAYILSKFPDASPNSSGQIHTRCPFHNDSRPSFSINVNEGVFICGSQRCGVRGTFPLFYKLMENISSWKEVFESLKEVSTDFDIYELLNGKKRAGKQYSVSQFPTSDCIEPIGSIKYLTDRGLGPDVISAYSLMYGKIGEFSGVSISQTIVAPVWDIDGTYKTFQLRCLNPDRRMRWVNPAGSPIQGLLYGGWLVNKRSPYLWLVEGASDTWKMFTFGQQAVGLNTKEASPAQMNRILTLCRLYDLIPIVCLDGDAHESAKKLWAEVNAMGLNPRLILLDREDDPGSLTEDKFNSILSKVVNGN